MTQCRYSKKTTLDWSPNKLIGVAFQNQVLLLKTATQEDNVIELMTHNDSFYSALKFSAQGNYLCVGDHTGSVVIRDIESDRTVSSQKHSNSRVVAISWMSEQVLSAGCENGEINTVDLRTKLFKSNVVQTEPVCVLAWSNDHSCLASGGGHGRVFLWELRR